MGIEYQEKKKMSKALNDAVEEVELIAPFDENAKGYNLDYNATNEKLGYKIKITIEKLIPDSAYL